MSRPLLLVSALSIMTMLSGCTTTHTPEELAKARVMELQEKCEPITGNMIGAPLGPKEVPYRIRVVLVTGDKVVWAVARNRDRWELLEWLKDQLMIAQEAEIYRVTICGAWLTDEYFEMVTGYDFAFTSITFWMPDAGPSHGRFVTMRTNYGDTVRDAIKENWWEIVKGILKRALGIARKGVSI